MHGRDLTNEIETAFHPTLQDIKQDPAFYAELVTDLLYHWIYQTGKTAVMDTAKRTVMLNNGTLYVAKKVGDNVSYMDITPHK